MHAWLGGGCQAGIRGTSAARLLPAGVRSLAAWPRSRQRAVYAAAADELDAGEARLGSGGRGAAVPGCPGRAAGADRAGRGPMGHGRRTTILSRRSWSRSSGGVSKAPSATMTSTRIDLDEDTQQLAGAYPRGGATAPGAPGEPGQRWSAWELV